MTNVCASGSEQYSVMKNVGVIGREQTEEKQQWL